MLLLALLLIAQPADTTAADSSRRDIVYYGGKRVIFFAKTEEVVLLDSAWVRYRDMSVYSDSIHYDVKRHQLSAHADVLFTSGSENITGNLLIYDVDSRKGMMRTAYTKVENGFFRANEAWLVRERVMDARGGSFTTCDRDRPHYVFYGPRVKLLMDDVAITEPVLFKLFNTPVLAAPFWMVPVASKRRSGLMPFKIGNSSTEGLYSKNLAYYWVINDYSDMTFYADVMTNSIKGALSETNRRREKQIQFNRENHITPETITKPIDLGLLAITQADYITPPSAEEEIASPEELEALILKLQKEMRTAAQSFEFEKAALLRDRIKALQDKEMEVLGD